MRPSTPNLPAVSSTPGLRRRARIALRLGVGLAAAAMAGIPDARAVPTAHFQGIGSLPGPANTCGAQGISGDGLTVSGACIVEGSTSQRAVYWTAEGGLVGLPGVPPYVPNGIAYDVSRDGRVLVGTTGLPGGNRPCYWGPDRIAVPIGPPGSGSVAGSAVGTSRDGNVVVGMYTAVANGPAFRWVAGTMSGLGLPPGDMPSVVARAVSDDGRIVVGQGTNASNQSHAIFWHPDSGIVGLPRLSGSTSSSAYDVSADGRYIAGHDFVSPNGYAVRIDRVAGIVQSLGDFPGGATASNAYGINANGQVVVGSGVTTTGDDAFVWTPTTGLRSVRQVLVSAGVDMTGWRLLRTQDVSDDGKVLVGDGVNPAGKGEGWIAILGPRIEILTPGKDAFLAVGDTAEASWAHFGVNTVDVHFLSPAGLTTLASGIPADSVLQWVVPPARSTRCRLIVQDTFDPAVVDTSDAFHVKACELTRLDATGEYEAFEPAKHGWSWANSEASQWTAAERVDYTGLDPVTQTHYPVFFRDGVFKAAGTDFPSWPLWVRTFTTNLTYSNPGSALYCEEALTRWSGAKSSWGGSCSGFSIAALMAFDDPALFAARFPDMGVVDRLYDQPLSPERRAVINELQTHVYRRAFDEFINGHETTPTETVELIKALLFADPRDDRWLYLANNSGAGAHAVVPYRVEEPAPDHARIFIYDPNAPGDPTLSILVLTDVADGAGSWVYSGLPGWGGTDLLYLGPPVSAYATPPTSMGPLSEGGAAPDSLLGQTEIYLPPIDDSSFTLQGGGTIGYQNGAIINTLAGGRVLRNVTGFERPPLGFLLPDGACSGRLDGFPGSLSQLLVRSGGIQWGYRREDVQNGESDTFLLGGGITFGNPDAAPRRLNLYSSRDNGGLRVMEIDGFGVSGGGSVELGYWSPERLRVVNRAAATNYRLRLRPAAVECGTGSVLSPGTGSTPNGGGEGFHADSVPIPAGAAHILDPDWQNLESGALDIWVDLGADGTMDDTLHVTNGISGIGEPPAAAGGPPALTVTPNPARNQLRIQFRLPVETQAELTVYDVLGRRVARPFSAWRIAGEHDVLVERGRLTDGIYFVELRAGAVRRTVRVVLTR